MKTLPRLKEVIPRLVDEVPAREELELGVVYLAPQYGTAVFLCPCGCGQETAISINDEIWGKDVPHWDYKFENDKVSFSPSILQRTLCKSHFFITNNKVRWC